jgi:predicted DNA-binding transcriptional regulator YafY
MAKNDQMLAILWMLNTGDKITAKQIAEKLEINIRTVYRYIDALSASGVPIISDTGHHGGYRLQNNFIKAPLLFDLEEKKALLHAAAYAKEAGDPSNEALESAISKLRMYANQEQESVLNHYLAGFEVINRMVNPSIQPILSELEYAVEAECSVEIDYRTGREEQPKRRKIDPYGMIYWQNKWYTVAFCHLRHGIRSFRVDRILTIEPTTLTFKRPETFSPRKFFMQNLLPDSTGGEALITVIIQGRTEALDELCLHWFLGHHLKARTSKEATFLFEANAIHRDVPYFLLPYGKSIQVIEPQQLKDRLAAVAAELLAYYQR